MRTTEGENVGFPCAAEYVKASEIDNRRDAGCTRPPAIAKSTSAKSASCGCGVVGAFLHPPPRTRHDVVQIALRGPSENAFGFLRIGHQNRRIARSPWPNIARNRAASDPFHRLHDFKNGVSAARPEIESQRSAALFIAIAAGLTAAAPTSRFKILQCPHVGIGKIIHVDVVADTSPIRSCIVKSKDLQLGPDSRRGCESQWNKVSFRVVHLANLAASVGACSVEITQAH